MKTSASLFILFTIYAINTWAQVGIGTTTPSGMLHVKPTTSSAIIIDPHNTSAGNTGEIQFKELSGGGTEYTGLKAPDAISPDVVFTLPSTDGSSGQALSTDGSGILNWTSAGSGVWEELGRKKLTSASDVITVDGGTSSSATFEDDFSTSKGWVTSDATTMAENIPSGNMTANYTGSSVNRAIVYDLGAGNVSDAEWTLRFEWTPGSWTGADNEGFFGLSSEDETFARPHVQDFLGVSFLYQYPAGPGQRGLYECEADNVILPPTNNTQLALGWVQGTTYYIELVRLSTTSFRYSVSSDDTYSRDLGSQTTTIAAGSGISGLRYIKFCNYNTAATIMNSTHDNVQFWNGQSDLSGFPVRKYLKVLTHVKCSGNANLNYRFNSDGGANYARRKSTDGASDGTDLNQNYVDVFGDDPNDKFNVLDIINHSSREKLVTTHTINRMAAGATNVPQRNEGVNKWTNTSESITSISLHNTQSGDYASGSEVVVLGYDPDCPNSSGIDLTDLKAYYKFNESSGNIINEAGTVGSSETLGSAADMTTFGGITYSAGGKIGNALDFDGTDDYCEMGTSLSQWSFLYEPNCTWSVSFWVYFDVHQSQTFWSSSDATETYENRMLFNATNAHAGLTIFCGSTVCRVIDQFNPGWSTPALSTWHHYVLTYDQTLGSENYKVYLNGQLGYTVNKANDSNVGNNQEYTRRLGARGDLTNSFFNGRFDEVSVWDRTLTPCEVEYLYNNGTGREL